MAFPDSPAGVKVELQLAGTWTDITSKVYTRDKIKMRRGRASEAQNVDPATCAITLDNRDGRFSPRNPTGLYYGLIGRNTPLRVKVDGLDAVSLQTTPPTSSRATTPHNAALNTGVGGDLDLRVEVVPFDTYGGAQDLIGKWDPTGSQASYLLWTDGEGGLELSWTTGGTGATQTNIASTVPIPRDNFRRLALRAVLDIDTGSSANSVTFYWADSIAGPWRQLGDVVTRAGVTSVFQGTAELSVCRATSSGSLMSMVGRMYAAQVRVGVGAATLAANADFTAATAGAGTYTDGTARVWTPSATASFATTNVRFVGEVSTWPAEWDPSGQDVYTPVVASGQLRRLQANVPPLRSTLRRSVPSLSTLRGYWPLEDAQGATSFAYGLPDALGQYSAAAGNGPSLAAYSGFLASSPIPTFGGQSYARCRVPAYTASGFVQLRFLLAIPSTGQPSTGSVIARLECSSTTWTLTYSTGGALVLTCVDNTGATIVASGALSMSLDGRLYRISLELNTSGANIAWRLQQLEVGASTGFFFNSTSSAATLGVARAVTVGCTGSSSAVAIGHVTVESSITSLFSLATQLNAYKGELAIARAQRLATEEGYTLYRQGPSASSAMGPQLPDQLIDLLREAADSDVGILYEMRGAAGLAFHPRSTMMARDAALTLTYAAGHLTSFQPVEDDRDIVNNVVLSRVLGSSYEVSLDVGTLSTAAPPNGVGKYQRAVSVSLATDAQLRDQASYRLGLGTIDEPRYPTLAVQLNRAGFAGSPGATIERCRAALDTDLGDIVQVDTPPGFYSPFTAYQRVEGVTEEIDAGGRLYEITYITSPGTLWRNVGVWNDPTNRTRYDTDASALAAGVTSVATSLSVATTDGTLWTTTDTPFDIVVAGEQMTVTAVAGASSPQTFTVTRSVNGVVKAQLIAAAVHVYLPSYYGF